MPSPLKARIVVAALLADGFVKKRQTGSHAIFRKGARVVVVPIHGSKDIPGPTVGSIMRQAGWEEWPET